MTRRRLRPAYDDEALRQLYPRPHDHRRWRDHLLRVDATIAMARWMTPSGVPSAADLSCGNGAILNAVAADVRYFGDFAPGHDITGPIEATIGRIPAVDLFICSETIEHLDDPDTVLKAVRDKATTLILSTPVQAWSDTNPEHYHAWDRDGVEQMLGAAGFTTVGYATVDLRHCGPQYYCFGIWGCT